MLRLTFKITLLLLLIAMQAYAEPKIDQNYKPANGYVPDTATAIVIAIAVLEPIYGHGQISKQKPFKANLSNGIWTVTGSLPKSVLGGVAVAEISKSDGRVLRVSHGQ